MQGSLQRNAGLILVGDSRLQDKLEWLFLPLVVLIAFAAIRSHDVKNWALVLTSLTVVISGWISFRAAGRAVYTDGLFAIDVCLVIAYALQIGAIPSLGRADGTAKFWAASTAINALYALWDFRVYFATRNDGRTHPEVVGQFLRFGGVTAACALGFLAACLLQHHAQHGATWIDVAGIAVWGLLLMSWHADRLIHLTTRFR